MTSRERYYWDLTGHLVVPNILSSDEVAAANEAIDYAVARTRSPISSAKAPSPGGSTEAWSGQTTPCRSC